MRLENSINSSNKSEWLFNSERDIGISCFSLSGYPSLGGGIKLDPKDFIVREILPSGQVIYDGSEIGKDVGGLYFHCVLWKTGIDTFNAIKRISNLLDISESDIGYAGLKDAQAETFQRISIWNSNLEKISSIKFDNLRVLNPIKQRFEVKIGDLKGNRFEIIIRDIQENWGKASWEKFSVELSEKGILNYYGPQRFGSSRPILHLFGKFILQQKYFEAVELFLCHKSKFENVTINSFRDEVHTSLVQSSPIRSKFPSKFSIENQLITSLNKKYSAKRVIFSLPTSFLRFSISAYQSLIFNKILSKLKTENNPHLSKIHIPLPGYLTEKQAFNESLIEDIKECLRQDDLTFSSFKHPEKVLKSKGGIRKAVIFPQNFKYHTDELVGNVKLLFDLPRGSYATILLREIIK